MNEWMNKYIIHPYIPKRKDHGQQANSMKQFSKTVNQPNIFKYWIQRLSSIRRVPVIMSRLCCHPLWLWPSPLHHSPYHGIPPSVQRWGKTKTNWVFFQMLLAIKTSQILTGIFKSGKISTFSTHCCKPGKYWKEERNEVNVHCVELTFGKLSLEN